MSRESIDEILSRFDALTETERAEVLARLEQRHGLRPNGAMPVTSLLQSFEARGLVGSIEGAPADWSTNPDHLAGFGNSSDAQ